MPSKTWLEWVDTIYIPWWGGSHAKERRFTGGFTDVNRVTRVTLLVRAVTESWLTDFSLYLDGDRVASKSWLFSTEPYEEEIDITGRAKTWEPGSHHVLRAVAATPGITLTGFNVNFAVYIVVEYEGSEPPGPEEEKKWDWARTAFYFTVGVTAAALALYAVRELRRAREEAGVEEYAG